LGEAWHDFGGEFVEHLDVDVGVEVALSE